MPRSQSSIPIDRTFVEKCFEAALKLSAKEGSQEHSLMTTKWFGYRFMHPMDATNLFAEQYLQAYRRKWARNFATNEAAEKLAFHRGNWRSSKTEFTACWKARQFVDRLGLPYDFFCEHALEFFLRRGYQKPPRPNQLYCERNAPPLAEYIAEVWTAHNEAYFMVSNLPQYHLSNFSAHLNQYAHQDWVVRVVRERHMKPALIARVCQELKLLPLDRAYFEFGPRRVELALEEAVTAPAVAAALKTQELRPSCFAILHAFARENQTCAECPFAEHCERVTEKLGKHIAQKCGDTDPVRARTRSLTRDRVRRLRQRRKLPSPFP
ncbi:hypothetical protein [Bradyrhizobium sp. LA6.12]|uniref:hypothetical protein n=1 Tax=unclassified Bradyrhizobium TaxID=2631580 RepID=UPI003391F04D